MGAATDLYDLCAEWLALCSDAADSTPGGHIGCQFVSALPPAFDGEILVVHAGGPALGDTAPLQPPLQPGHRIQQTGLVNLVQVTATVLRCVALPDNAGNPPTPEEEDAAAQVTTSDVWAIWNYAVAKFKRGTLFASGAGTRELYFDPALPVGGGAYGGWQIPIRVSLFGYSKHVP